MYNKVTMASAKTNIKRIIPIGTAVALSLFGDLTLFTVLVTQLEVTHLTLAQVGILLSIHRLIRIPLNPLIGILQDRIGRRIPFLTGLTLAMISTCMYGVVHGFIPFLISRLLWGTAWGLINVGGMSMTLDLCTPKDRGKLAGLYNTFIWIGFAIGPALGGRLTDTEGFKIAMLICSGVAAMGLLLSVFLIRETYPDARQNSHPRFTWHDFLVRLNPLANNREILRIQILLAIFMFAGDGVVLSTLTLLLKERLGNTLPFLGSRVGVATFSGSLFAIRSVVAALSSPLAGRIADHFGRKPVLSTVFLMSTGSYLFMAFTRSQGGLVLSAILTAFCGGAIMVMLMSTIGDYAQSTHTGTAMGQFAMMGDIGSSLGPTLAFTLIPLIGIHWVYTISAILLCFSCIFSAIPIRSPQSASTLPN
jgi:MFS family permease